jgi:MiaB/RimO family radical SAM methylthiotransferase
MNYSDSARITSVLKNCWFSPVETIDDADIIIFDTCSVRQKSEDKVTWKLKEIPLTKKVWITWCMIQHTMRNAKISEKKDIPEQLKVWNFSWSVTTKEPKILWITSDEINELRKGESDIVGINHAFNPLFHSLSQKWPNIELFFRIDDTGFLPLMLKRLWYEVSYDKELTNEYSTIIPEWINSSMNSHNKTAYIPISSWCNQFCAYCIVPFARWLEKWFSVDQIVREAKIHLANGVKEISLLGQIVNKHPDFVTIIKELLKLEWLEWLRYTSPYPTYYSDELLKLHENEGKLCPHIHIPFQSWSDVVLKKMFRGYSAQQCYDFIDKIRGLKRPISITTDIILWFPWETDEDFENLISFIKEDYFNNIALFEYHDEKLAESTKLPNKVDDKTIRERFLKAEQLVNELLRKRERNRRDKEFTWIVSDIYSKDDKFEITIRPSINCPEIDNEDYIRLENIVECLDWEEIDIGSRLRYINS